jgi:hypothetical protein
MADQDASVVIRASCTLVTDGIELNVATAPASAYLVTVVLLGGSGVSNAYASTFTTPAVIDTGTDVTDPGFLPSLVFVTCYADNPIDDTNDANAYINFGVALASGTQYSVNWYDVSGVATTDVIASVGSLTVAREVNNSVGQEVELGSFDASGFTATTRANADDTACGYLAVRLNGLTASLVAIDTPIATGTWVVSGLGITPQFGMLLQNSMASYDTRISTTSAEVFGISAFTSATDEYSVAVTSDDGVTTTTNAESVTANKAVLLRKDAATYMAADFTAFGSGTATFDVTSTAIASARKWAGLFISAAASSRSAAPIIFQ